MENLKELLFESCYDLIKRLEQAWKGASCEVIQDLEARYCALRELIFDADLCKEFKEFKKGK